MYDFENPLSLCSMRRIITANEKVCTLWEKRVTSQKYSYDLNIEKYAGFIFFHSTQAIPLLFSFYFIKSGTLKIFRLYNYVLHIFHKND